MREWIISAYMVKIEMIRFATVLELSLTAKKKKRQFQDVEPVERGVIYYYSNLGKESVCRDVKVAYVNLLFGFFWCVLVCVCERECVSVCVTSNKDNYKGVVDTHPLRINYLCVCSAKY